MSLAQIARRIGVSVGTVHRVKQIMIVNGNADPNVQQAA
jgi:DNA-binding LacI/PurR family transcriptional regulator